jgi:hypothetical protein
MSAKKPSGISLIRSPEPPRAEPQRKTDRKQLRFRRGEKAEFQRLQKRAKKAGLLLNRSSYELYFRDERVEL